MKGKISSKNKKIFIWGILTILIFSIVTSYIKVNYKSSRNLENDVDYAAERNYNWNPNDAGLTPEDIIKAAVAEANDTSKTTYVGGCITFVDEIIKRAANEKGIVVNITNNNCSSWNGTINGVSINDSIKIGANDRAIDSTPWYDTLGGISDFSLQPGDIIVGEGHAMVYMGQGNTFADFNENLQNKYGVQFNNYNNWSEFDGKAIQDYTDTWAVSSTYWTVDVNGGSSYARVSDYNWSDNGGQSVYSCNLNNIKIYRFQKAPEGKYYMNIAKRSTTNDSQLPDKSGSIGGVQFNVEQTLYNESTISGTVTTVADNVVDVLGEKIINEIGEGKPDTYKITEVTGINGYETIDLSNVTFDVYKKLSVNDKFKYVIDYVKVNKDGEEIGRVTCSETESQNDEGTFDIDGDGIYDIGIELGYTGNTITVTVRNKPVGKYHIYIGKRNADNKEEPVPDAVFNVKKYKDQLESAHPSEEGLDVTTVISGDTYSESNKCVAVQIGDKDGILNEKTITNWENEITDITKFDKYEIYEKQAPLNYIKSDDKLIVEVHKGKRQSDGIYIIEKLKLSIVNSEGTESEQTELVIPEEGNGIIYLDNNGNIVEDSNGNWQVKVEANGEAFIIYWADETKKTGKFNLDLIKYVKNTTIPLAGAEFQVSVKDENETELVDVNKRYVTGDEGHFTEKVGGVDGIAIEAENKTYAVTVTETDVPIGYEGISGPITFNVTSKLVGNTYVLEADKPTPPIANAKKVTVTDDQILIEAENTPEKPHKGVKEVYNQDSGYYDEVTGAVYKDEEKLESIQHDWVVTSKIPSGIDKYGKYIITDQIDERLDFSGVDSVKVSLLDGETLEKTRDLVEGTDYKVSYGKNVPTKTAQDIVAWAEAQVGKQTFYNKYFDKEQASTNLCTAFVESAYYEAGLAYFGGNAQDLPHANEIKYDAEGNVDWSDIPVGAVIVSKGAPVDGVYYGHVCLYVGNGEIIEAGGNTISKSSIDDSYAGKNGNCGPFLGWGFAATDQEAAKALLVEQDTQERALKVSFIEGSFTGGRSLPAGSIVEIRFNTTFARDENRNIKAINQSVPNQATLTYGDNNGNEVSKETEKPEVHTGGVRIFKFDEETGLALQGAKFKIATSEENARNKIFVKNANGEDIEKESNDKGIAVFEGLEFGEDAKDDVKYQTGESIYGMPVYKYDWDKVETTYYIVETYVPEKYVLKTDPIKVTVKYTEYDEEYLTGYHRVGNTPINETGSYKVQVIKNKPDGTPLAGVQFSASSVTNGESKTIATKEQPIETQVNPVDVGEVVTIIKENVETDDVYTLKEEAIGEANKNKYYIGITENIVINISKQSVESDDGTKIVNSVKDVTLGEIEEATLSEDKKTLTFTNGSEVTVAYANGVVTITVKNPELNGSYNLNIGKKSAENHEYLGTKDGDTDNYIVSDKDFLAGAQFSVVQYLNTDKEPSELGDGDVTGSHNPIDSEQGKPTQVIFSGKHEIDITNVENIDIYKIKEEKAPPEFTVNNEEFYLKVYKKINDDKSGFSIEKVDVCDSNGISLIYMGPLKDYNNGNETQLWGSKTFDKFFRVDIDKATNTIVFVIGNEKVEKEGKYDVYLKKVGTDGVQLGGIIFERTAKVNGQTENLPELETDSTNTVLVKEVSQIEEESLSDPDVYTIKEIRANTTNAGYKEGYYLGLKDVPIELTVTKGESSKSTEAKKIYEVKSLTLKVGDQTGVAGTSSTVEKTINGEKVTIKAELVGSTITITVENPKVVENGQYNVNLLKKGTDGEVLSGVKFTAKRKVNGETEYKDLEPIETQGTEVAVGDTVTIEKEHVGTDDEYVIRETNIGEANKGKYYIGITKDIIVKVKKTSTESEDGAEIVNSVMGVTLEIEGETVNKISDTESTVTLENGTVVTVSLNTETKTITITVKNPQRTDEGKYSLQLEKRGLKEENGALVEGDRLGGVTFTVSGTVDGKAATIESPITTDETKAVDVIETDIRTIDEDTFRFTETDIGSNSQYYLGTTKTIVVKVQKTKDETTEKTTYRATGVTIDLEGAEESEIKSKTDTEIVLTNGTIIRADFNNGVVKLIVSNPKKEGTFKLNLVKHIKGETTPEGNPKPLPGASFKITINDGTSDIYTSPEEGLTTGSNGDIPEITGLDITAENLTYAITVEETHTPEGYIGLAHPVTFNAVSKAQGGEYVLETQEKTEFENNFYAEVKPDEILIEVENRVEPVIHKGVKTVENQDSGYDKNEIQTWVINTTIPTGIAQYTKYMVTDEIDPEKEDIAQKRITFINEDQPEQNVAVKVKGTDTTLTANTDYQVDFNKDTKILTITFINGDAFRGVNLPENSTLEITFNTKFALDENGNIIGINQSIPNQAQLTFNGNGKEDKEKPSEKPEVHTGGVGVYKFDRDTKTALEGAKFKLTRTKEEADKAVAALISGNEEELAQVQFVQRRDDNGNEVGDWEVITDSTGHAKFEGLEFGEDAYYEGATTVIDPITNANVYKYDWSKVETKYYIVETEVPGDYVLLKTPFEVTVKPENYNEELDLTKYYEVENHKSIETGDYVVSIQKNGKSKDGQTEAISGVRFEAKRKVNRAEDDDDSEFEDIVTPGQDALVTDSTGYAQVGDVVTMEKESKDIPDIYVIKEKSVPETSKYYLGFDGEITLKVNKGVVLGDNKEDITNVVTGIVMEIDGADAQKVNDFKYIAKVTKDGQELELVAEFDRINNILELTVENPYKVGEFNLNIIKYLKGTNNKQTLKGAGFKVSIKSNEVAVKDKDGNEIDGSHEYFVDDNGQLKIEGINLDKAGTVYDIEISETTVPNGYIGIGEPIKYSATCKEYSGKLGLSEDSKTISNDVEVNVEEDEIWIDVQNKPEPVIHKGVKTVENQDSGYDKNEIQKWVIESTIPVGIDDYTKYVVTDEIDPEKTNVAEKRITFVDEDHPEQNVVVKIKGTDTTLIVNKDYQVTFNKDTKILTITFIDGNAFRGENLPENSTLEITFNTKFALDENGNIIGINQSIPNQAKLTFNGNGKEDKYRFSEKPEVHTGGVGVFKYDDANKNGKYDDGEKALVGAHFRATRSKTEAQKAIAIILKYEAEGKTKEELEEALNEIDFVKERSEDGKETKKAIEVVTGKDGKAVIEGLEFGEDAIERIKQTIKDPITGADVYTYEWDKAETKYYLVETETPQGYLPLDHEEEVIVKAQNYNNLNLTKYYELANKPKIYDLSLRKFITQVEDKKITNREPKVTLTDEFKDEENDDVTTAIYEHTKEPVVVQQGDIVTYTIRIYNEGPEDAYASVIKDDIPDGVEFVQYTEGDGSLNDKYRWKLVDENDNKVTDASKAKYIITDYLSMEQGIVDENGNNSNLLSGFNSKTMDKLDYRDVQVQFKVIEPNTSERILINYAQISKETDGSGRIVEDRDSIPNVWNEGEDDQDIEKIKLLYFDLALRKWVTKAIVYENGKEHVFETGHKAEDDPEDVVKVDLKKSRLDKVVVKFEYQIRVTNQGKIGGWADELTDHIPEGLKFEQADNPIWTPVDERTITTNELKDVYLDPGESTEVTVVLTWINSGDNLGIKDNIAEISRDRNEYGVPDIDSIPGNYKWGEDDIDDAPVMLSITTGDIIGKYAMLGIMVLTIIALGVKFVRKTYKELK